MVRKHGILVLTDCGGRHYWPYEKRKVYRRTPLEVQVLHLYQKNSSAFLEWKGAGHFILKPNGRGLYVLEKIG